MLEQFIKYTEEHSLVATEGNPVGLALSGGIDSVVMAKLFSLAGFPFAIIHCNFRLRADESDLDELFVSGLAKTYGVPFYLERFETAEYAKRKKLSVQMAARELRMKWFADLVERGVCCAVATAHHADDDIETFFINLHRSGGLPGLSGIRPRNGIIIHPMLFAARDAIFKFAKENGLTHREDSSNAKLDYFRNKVRHIILPALDRTDPDFRLAIGKSMKILRETDSLLEDSIRSIRDELLVEKEGLCQFSREAIKAYGQPVTVLYYLLRPFGFNYEVAGNVYRVMNGEAGRQFHSASHSLLIDRENIVIRPVKIDVEKDEFMLPPEESSVTFPLALSWQKIDASSFTGIDPDPDMAFLDAGKLQFPLTLRKWRQGDAFYPLGMRKRKKLSDFFIDLKLSVFEKQDIWLLCSAGQIVWVTGYRIDERFKVDTLTQQILMMVLQRPIS